jgi:hypothetical protein
MDVFSILSARHLDAGAARRCLVLQHQNIRALLAKARALAERALDGQALSSAQIARTIADIRKTVEIHLRFETHALAVILDDEGPTSDSRTVWFRLDHARQRDGLAALYREAMAGPDLPILAAKLAFVTTWLSNDMAEEERALSIAT